MIRQGIGKQESWSRWVQQTQLQPGMDANDWYHVYDQAKATAHTGHVPGTPDVFGGHIPPPAAKHTPEAPTEPEDEEHTDYARQLGQNNYYSDDDIREEYARYKDNPEAWQLPHIKEAAQARGIDFEKEAAQKAKKEAGRAKRNAAARAGYAARTSTGMKRTPYGWE